jgi:hypothetical protein
MKKVTALATAIYIILFVLSQASGQGYDQYDQFITKKFADYLFDLKKSQWENGARKVFPPNGRLKHVPQITGGVIYAFPSGGPMIEFGPFFWDANFPTTFIMVTFYYPSGTRPPIDEESKKEIDVSMQRSLGPSYSVEASYSQGEKWETVQFAIKKPIRPGAP